MAANDVLLNKAATIERCVTRIRTERGRLVADEIAQTVEDSVVLNIQRACEASIDAAMHVVRVRELGIPQDRRDGFRLLAEAKIIDEALCRALQRMVGFRNIAVHDYQRIARPVIDHIVAHGLEDLLRFARIICAL
jgi:uncharacterized protein YutE (UPF0331/DUF86 family)